MALEPYGPTARQRSWRQAHNRSMIDHGGGLTVMCVAMALITLVTAFDGFVPFVGRWDDQLRLPAVFLTILLGYMAYRRIRSYR